MVAPIFNILMLKPFIATIKSTITNKYVLLKIFSITVMVLWGFGQPYIFNRHLSTNDFSFITVGYGSILFLDLFDLGISRVIYADIRNKFINKDNYSYSLSTILGIYIYVLLLTIIVFCIFLLLISSKLKNDFSTITIILWGIGISLNANFSYFRYILFAVDEFILFEKLDILRKTISFLLLLIIIWDNSFFVFSVLSIIMFGFIYLKIYKVLKQKHAAKIKGLVSNFRETLKLFRSYTTESKWSFFYYVTHIVNFNSGFLILPFFLINSGIIQYGLWQKFAYGVTMIIVAISDLGLHKTTKLYFLNDFFGTRVLFRKTIYISLISVIIIFLFIFVTKKILFQYWVSNTYLFSLLMFGGLLLFFVGRAFQYVSTTLILSFGYNYKTLGRIGFFSMVFYHSLLAYILFNHLSLDYVLLLFGFTVLIEGFIYCMLFNQQLVRKFI